MFSFFRKNVVIIGWSIVIFFAATMFTGGLFFGFNFSDNDNTPSASQQNNFGSLGEYPLSVEYFSQFFNTYLTAVYNQTDAISPVQLENIILESFNKVVEHDAFYIAAMQNNVELSSLEKKSMEKEFLLENNIKSKSELKKILKENNRSYKEFEKNLNKELVVRKFKNLQLSDVTIDDYIIDNSFKSFKYDVLIVSNPALIQEELSLRANEVVSNLKTKDIKQVQSEYEDIVSINVVNNDNFVSYYQLDPQLRGYIKDLEFGVYTSPDCLDSYCFSVNFIDETVSEKPEDFKIEEYSTQLKSFLQNEKLTQILSDTIEKNPLNVISPDIQAVYYKSIGDFTKSLIAYQQLSSNLPESPSPHFFRAQIYKQLNNDSLVLSELQKANLKSKLDPENDFPELHIFYGDELYETDKPKSISQYEIALELSKNNMNYLKLLKERFESNGESRLVKDADEKIALLEKALEEKQKELDAQLISTPNIESATLD